MDRLVIDIAVLVLAGFVGYTVISKVPNTLHTPLMSGTNAIHGIVVLGGLLLMAESAGIPIAVPMTTPRMISQTVLEPWNSPLRSSVAMTAMAMPTAAILLPRTAVRGPVSPVMP